MKKVIILIVIIICGYYFWNNYMAQSSKLEPLYDRSYIVVYGRDSCGWTQKYRKELGDMNIFYIYKSVDDKNVADELHQRMEKAGLDTSYYNLPVIDVNANILIRPEMKKVLDAYKQ
jgi:hypothetical protein